MARTPMGALGLIAAGLVGPTIIGIAMRWSPEPVSPREARALADGYNTRLKGELGLAAEGGPAPVRPPDIQARLTPVVGPGGAGLQLSGMF